MNAGKMLTARMFGVSVNQNRASWNHVSLWLRRLQVAFHHMVWTG
jgi:hypothetical protein